MAKQTKKTPKSSTKKPTPNKRDRFTRAEISAAKKAATKPKLPVVTADASKKKMLVQDACAADGCTKAPAKGSSYCAEHGALKQAEQGAHAVLASVAKAQPSKGKQVQAQDAGEAIRVLLGKGWTQATIADALSTSPGRVWFWANGKACRRIADVLSLTFLDAPLPDVVRGGKLSKTARSAYAKALKVTRTDPRQLLLDLRESINATLRAMR